MRFAPTAASAASTASIVVIERMPVAAWMRALMICGPITRLAAVQLKTIRSTCASASSCTCSSSASASRRSDSSDAERNGSRVVRNCTPAGAINCGS